mgnify:CR=1 FL=1
MDLHNTLVNALCNQMYVLVVGEEVRGEVHKGALGLRGGRRKRPGARGERRARLGRQRRRRRNINSAASWTEGPDNVGRDVLGEADVREIEAKARRRAG